MIIVEYFKIHIKHDIWSTVGMFYEKVTIYFISDFIN